MGKLYKHSARQVLEKRWRHALEVAGTVERENKLKPPLNKAIRVGAELATLLNEALAVAHVPGN